MNLLVKNSRKSIWIASILLVTGFIAIPAGAQTQSSEKPEIVSLIKLIADSRSANRKTVAVGGYLKVTGPYILLYVSSEHAEASDILSAVLLELDEEQKQLALMMDGNWARVVGKFEHNLPSAEAPYSGKITAVQEVKKI